MRRSRWQFCWNLYTIGFVNFVDQEIEFRCIQMLVSFSLKLNRETRLQKWNIAFSIQTKVRSGARIIPHANSCCVYERQSPFAGCVQSDLISRLRIQKRDLEYYRWRSWYNRSCSFVFYSTDKINQSPVIRKSNHEIGLQKLMFLMTFKV